MMMIYTLSFSNDNGIYNATVEPLNADSKNLFGVVFSEWEDAREAAHAVSQMADKVQQCYQSVIEDTHADLSRAVDKICAEIKESQIDTPTALETFADRLKGEIGIAMQSAMW